jgi:hypothetical protein
VTVDRGMCMGAGECVYTASTTCERDGRRARVDLRGVEFLPRPITVIVDGNPLGTVADQVERKW